MWTKLDRYFLKEAIPALCFGLLIYSGLAVISVTLPRLQWIVGTPLAGLSYWLILQLPQALVQTLPIALVLSVLLAFGRLATSNELLAIQAGGISIGRGARIFLMLGLLLVSVALVMNERVLPATNAKVGSLYWQLTSGGSSGLWRLAAQNIPLDGYTLHFEQADRGSDDLINVRLESWQDKELTVLFADRGRFTEGGLELSAYQITTIDLAALRQEGLTAEELLTQVLRRFSLAPQPEQTLLITTSSSMDELITRFSGGGFEDSRSIREAYLDAQDLQLSERERRLAAVLFHRKLAEPFANLSLLLIALPLSLLYAASRSVAFGLSLVVTLAWYVLFTIGQLFAQAGVVPVWLGVWLAHGVLGSLGLYLLLVRVRLR